MERKADLNKICIERKPSSAPTLCIDEKGEERLCVSVEVLK